jgi:hypothetical protein
MKKVLGRTCGFSFNKMKKRGNILTENIIFIILNLVFISIIVLYLSLRTGDSFVMEEIYAKQIALMIDASKPNMIISLNMEEGISKLEKERNKKITEFSDSEIKDIVKINENIVSVSLTAEEGKSYSYSFFNNVNVTPNFDKEKKEFYFVIKAFEKPVEGGTIQG